MRTILPAAENSRRICRTRFANTCYSTLAMASSPVGSSQPPSHVAPALAIPCGASCLWAYKCVSILPWASRRHRRTLGPMGRGTTPLLPGGVGSRSPHLCPYQGEAGGWGGRRSTSSQSGYGCALSTGALPRRAGSFVPVAGGSLLLGLLSLGLVEACLEPSLGHRRQKASPWSGASLLLPPPQPQSAGGCPMYCKGLGLTGWGSGGRESTMPRTEVSFMLS